MALIACTAVEEVPEVPSCDVRMPRLLPSLR